MYTEYDALGNLIISRPFTPEEQALQDLQVAEANYQTAKEQYLADLNAGIANITAARNTAQADAASMDAVIADLIVKRDAVAAFAVPATYQVATITAIKNELVAIRNYLIADAQYRKAVDLNAVTTDNALLWIGRVLTKNISEE